ncbi:MAG TPA: tetratricopeptide repeat protein [Verrucomicrobiae bacterium]|nr:tetratricopeptide repeat protein [Verrucomicrobiae bacterium]
MNFARTIRRSAKSLLFAVLALALLNRLPLRAHDSPEHEIEVLTSRMSKAGKTGSLLMRRATEFKALGELDKAAADLTEAISLEPKSPAAYAELGRVQFAQGKLAEACDNATRSLTLIEDAGERGAVFLLRAQIEAARGRNAEALADCELADRRDDLDWYLIRSQIQRSLGKLDARVAGLKDGFARNGSIVLEIESIEAMIDAGQFHPALDLIDQHLNQLRLRSSWLLRRARALKGLKADFQADAKAALAELERRIRPEHPEPTLLLDRATAFALLGNEKAAREDIKAAQKHGMPASACDRVESLLKSSKLVAAETTAAADKQKTTTHD